MSNNQLKNSEIHQKQAQIPTESSIISDIRTNEESGCHSFITHRLNCYNLQPEKAGADYSRPSSTKFPKLISVRFENMKQRGVKIIDRETGKHIKTVRKKLASELKAYGRLFYFCFPKTKRITGDEYNQFILHKYINALCMKYDSKLFKLSLPDQVFRNIVFDRNTDNKTEIYYSLTLTYSGLSYHIRISKPDFKKLVAPARINHRYIGDNFKEISNTELKQILCNNDTRE